MIRKIFDAVNRIINNRRPCPNWKPNIFSGELECQCYGIPMPDNGDHKSICYCGKHRDKSFQWFDAVEKDHQERNGLAPRETQ